MIGSIGKRDSRSITSQKSLEKKASFSSNSSKEENEMDGSGTVKEDIEKEEFVLKEIPDQEEEALGHDIFQQLCPEDKHKKNSHCYVCKTKFRAFKMSGKKRCKFCGYNVCSDHSRKKRPDPQNKSSFVTICDRCDYQYLYRVIFEEYDKRKLEKEAKINALEAQLMELKDILVKKQNELAEMKKEKQRRDEEYAEQAEGLTKKIKVLNNEIRKIEVETTELNKNYTQVNESIKDIDKSLGEIQTEYSRLQQENEELTHQIVAIDKDIEQTTTIIQKIEDLISQAKIDKGVSNIYKEAYKNKAEEDENSKRSEDHSLSPPTNGKGASKNPTVVQGQAGKNGTVVGNPRFPQDGKIGESPEHCQKCIIF